MKQSHLSLPCVCGSVLLAACGGSSSGPTPDVATHLAVAVPATAVTGAAFELTVTALDAANHAVTSYSGTVHFSSTDAAAALPVNSTLTDGARSFAVTLRTGGSQTISATDTATTSISGISPAIDVSGPATHFSVSAPPMVRAGTRFGFAVSALDATNRVAGSYTGSVHFSSTDGQAALPANSTLTNGSGNFQATLHSDGEQTIKATDTAVAEINGTSNGILAYSNCLLAGAECPPNAPPCCQGLLCTTEGDRAYCEAAGAAASIPRRVPSRPAGPAGALAQTRNVAAAGTDGALTPAAAVKQGRVLNRHHHYKLIKIGTFGGPQNYLSTDDYLNVYIGASQDLNDAGVLTGWADTSTPDPNAPNCFSGDCYVSQGFVWLNGGMVGLGTLPHGASSASAWVSANGLVAGTAQNGEFDPLSTPSGWPENRAVLWRNGAITDLGVLPEEGGYESGAEAVNSSGQVVGWTLNKVPDPYSMDALSQLYNFYQPTAEYYQMRAFLWEDGVMQDLGTLGSGTDAYAMAINEQGQVIGISYTNSTPNQVVTPCSIAPIPTEDPFLWEHGKMIDLGTLGGTCGVPLWISNSGEVVGQSDLAGDQEVRPFLWTKARGMQDLGTLGGTFGFASWVNDSGVAVGGSRLAGDTQSHAFLWDGSMHDLGAINGCSWAWAINARGQVVGNSGSDCSDVGFLWEDGGPMVDLNMLVSSTTDISVVAALEINDRGEVAGAATDSNGNLHLIILIPCDDDHPGIEGCDYAWVDSDSLVQPSIAPIETSKQPGVLHRGIAPDHRRGVLGLRFPQD